MMAKIWASLRPSTLWAVSLWSTRTTFFRLGRSRWYRDRVPTTFSWLSSTG